MLDETAIQRTLNDMQNNDFFIVLDFSKLPPQASILLSDQFRVFEQFSFYK